MKTFFSSEEQNPTGDNWRDEAACRHHDPEIWFSDNDSVTERAKRICATQCPVRWQCHDWAERTVQRNGVWGGYDEDEREVRRKARLKIEQEVAPEEGGTPLGKAEAALYPGLPTLERMQAAVRDYQGKSLETIGELLGYTSPASFERALYRQGKPGRDLLAILRPNRVRKEQLATVKGPGKGRIKFCTNRPRYAAEKEEGAA